MSRSRLVNAWGEIWVFSNRFNRGEVKKPAVFESCPAGAHSASLRPRYDMNNYRKLDVWNIAMDCAQFVYEFTAAFPPEERYGLCAQMRRCAVSIPSNIAEGQGRISRRESRHFMGISRGSLYELETQMDLAERMGFGDGQIRDRINVLIRRLNRLITATIRSLGDSVEGPAPGP